VTSESDDSSVEGSFPYILKHVIPGVTITFAPNVKEITLTKGHIQINKGVIIDGGSVDNYVTFNGNNKFRIFEANSPDITLKNLIICNGNFDTTATM